MNGASFRCPICGERNDCGLAQGKPSCWCFERAPSQALVHVLETLGIDDRCLCPRCAAGEVPSPCIRTCVLDQSTATCAGCRRTLAEIVQWSALGPEERARILLRLRQH